ncbi:HNH endonuclease signature motif containing protein [Rhodovulum sp. YEN HP10]|uniref:HNH endonuclease signature motif containing protein n=1 Tax=Rhodovulum sp. HP10 TaxID=3387397 RepID=UPI0039E0AD25
MASREAERRRTAAKRKASPPWLTDEHLAAIRAVYAEAARLTEATGIPHHVDHIIPLTHPDVQGLHVPWNLQVLTTSENQSKGNSFDGTMENEGWRTAVGV